MEECRLNVVLHRITQDAASIQSRYDVTGKFALELIERLEVITENASVGLNVFLDDGYQSQYFLARRLSCEYGVPVSIALIAQLVGTEEYLSQENIDALKEEENINFSSHGVSHAALGVYKNDRVVETPRGGRYANAPRGHASILTENEIFYQLKESKRQLAERGIDAEDFVYPYGIYSGGILGIVEREGSYTKAYTCDIGLEQINVPSLAIPRLLIDNTLSVSEWTEKVKSVLK